MRRLSGWRPVVSSEIAESARDCLARSQAALADEHLAGARRHFLELYSLLVPPLDAWMQKRAGGEAIVSSAVGFLGLWDELLDIDVERESLEELLVWHAAQAEPKDAKEQNPTLEDLEAALLLAAPPRSQFFRRLGRRAAGSLGDLAHIMVLRGTELVLERRPAVYEGDANDGEFSTDIGELAEGDRLTLRLSMPLPGQLAVLHTAGDGFDAEVTLLLPADPNEAVARRRQELVEVTGEIAAVAGSPEHSLIVVWGPELLPQTWADEVVARRRVPVGARVFEYRYRVRSRPA